MIRLGPPKGAFYYLPWRRRQFKLAGVCQLVLFRPHASSLRKEAPCRAAGKKLPKENPSKGFSLDSFGNKRAAALLRSPEAQIYSTHPVERLLRILEALSFWHASTYWHVKSLTILLPSNKFGRLVRRKAFLLCKNPCGAGVVGVGGLGAATGWYTRSKAFPSGEGADQREADEGLKAPSIR